VVEVVEAPDIREVAWKVYEKIVPNLGLAIAGPAGALAASALVVSTWLLARTRGWLRSGKAGKSSDEEALIEVYRELRRAERALEDAKAAGASPEALRALEEKVSWLREEYELIQVRIAAKEALQAIGGRELVEKLEEVVERLEKGDEKAVGEVYDVLREVEAMWRRRELEAQALRRLLSRESGFLGGESP
jgi:hypothetical protein